MLVPGGRRGREAPRWGHVERSQYVTARLYLGIRSCSELVKVDGRCSEPSACVDGDLRRFRRWQVVTAPIQCNLSSASPFRVQWLLGLTSDGDVLPRTVDRWVFPASSAVTPARPPSPDACSNWMDWRRSSHNLPTPSLMSSRQAVELRPLTVSGADVDAIDLGKQSEVAKPKGTPSGVCRRRTSRSSSVGGLRSQARRGRLQRSRTEVGTQRPPQGRATRTTSASGTLDPGRGAELPARTEIDGDVVPLRWITGPTPEACTPPSCARKL
jgi:hypothetical protein